MIWTYLNPDWLMMLMIFWRVRQSDYQLRAICCWPSSIGVLLIHILRYSWYWLLSWQVGIGGIPLRKSRPVEVWYIYIYTYWGYRFEHCRDIQIPGRQGLANRGFSSCSWCVYHELIVVWYSILNFIHGGDDKIGLVRFAILWYAMVSETLSFLENFMDKVTNTILHISPPKTGTRNMSFV
jgi:hypothetical protein